MVSFKSRHWQRKTCYQRDERLCYLRTALYIDKEGAIQTLTPSGDDEQFIIPGTYNENTKFFLFHRYMEQLRGEYLKYALDLMYDTKLPVVYLANDYSKEEEPQADVSAFEEWECSDR